MNCNSPLQRGPMLCSIDHLAKDSGIIPQSLKIHIFFHVWISGLLMLPSLSSKLPCLCGSFQAQNILGKKCRDGRRDEGWKEGLLMQHACMTSLSWSTCLQGAAYSDSLPERWHFPVPPTQLTSSHWENQVTTHKKRYYRTVFVLGQVTGAHLSESNDILCVCITWFHSGWHVSSALVFNEL